MSIPYLPGIGDTLAQALPQIGNNVAHIVNPNIDFQKMLQAAIAKDPTLLQQIANNPGLAQSLQSMGAGNKLTQQLSPLSQDPMIGLNQETAKTNLALGQSNLNVAKGTEGSRISEAGSNAANAALQPARTAAEISNIASQTKFNDLKYTEAKTDFERAQAAIAKYPNANVTAVAQSLIAGKPVDSQMLTAIGPEGMQAAKLYAESYNAAKERVKDMSVAQLIHHSATDQDKLFNLKVLQDLSVGLRGQLNAAVTASKTKLDQMTVITAQSPEPKAMDKVAHDNWVAARQAVAEHNNLTALAGADSPLIKKLNAVNAEMAIISSPHLAAALAADPTEQSNTSNNDPIAMAKDMFAKGQLTAAQVQEKVNDGTLTPQQAAQILGAAANKPARKVKENPKSIVSPKDTSQAPKSPPARNSISGTGININDSSSDLPRLLGLQ